MKKILAISAISALMTGCLASTRPIDIGKDTYSVSATSDGFRTAVAARGKAFDIGQKKCKSMTKNFLLLTEQMQDTRMGIDTTVTVVFMCLAEDDPRYQQPR